MPGQTGDSELLGNSGIYHSRQGRSTPARLQGLERPAPRHDDDAAPTSPARQPAGIIPPDEWASWPDEKLLDLRISQLGVTIEGSVLESRIAELQRELDARGLAVRAALLAVGRMVLARRRAGRGDPVLPRASAAREARTRADARGRGGHRRLVHEDPAARGGTRHRQRLQAAAAAAPPAALRPVVHAVSRLLHAEAVQQELRAAPRQLVRAEPSGRGFRGDVRGVAEPGSDWRGALRRLAGAEEAGVHGRADARARRQADARADAPEGRAAAEPAEDAARALRAQAPPLRRRASRTSTIAICGGCSQTVPSTPAT